MKKHLLTTLLILALLLLLAPAAFADGENYTVTFNANGGWFGNGINTTIEDEYAAGEPIHGTIVSLVNPDRHMAFEGWYYDAACTQPAFDRDEYYIVTGDVTFYAGWTEGCIITFDAGDGLVWGNKTAEVSYPKDCSPNFTPGVNISDPELVFDYWTLADGTEVNIFDYILSGDITVYAHYSKGYTVTFDANGGWFWNNENNRVFERKFTEGSSLLGRNYEPANPDRHMALKGWYYDAACTEPAFGWDERYTVTGNVTLYAGWTEGYIVTFDPGNGFFTDGKEVDVYTIPKGSLIGNYNIPESLYKSLEFDYWTLADGTRVNTWSYIPTGDITLYAHYSTRYTVTYNANGGWFGDNTNETELIIGYPEGDRIWSGNYEPVNPDRHLAFAGWYYDAACTQQAIDRNGYYTVTGDVTLYAGWTEGYIVTYNANGGWFWNDENVTEIITSCPKGIQIHTVPDNPDRHTAFAGWYYDAACTQFACDRDADYTVTGDVTLYAGWAEGYIVTFDAGEGQFGGGGKTYDVTIPKGSVIRSYNRPEPSDQSLEFDYWTLENGDKVNVFSYNKYEDVTFYAHYSTRYTVTYNANGGWFGDNTNETELIIGYPEGANIWARAYEPVHPDRHMIFDGWYYDTACTQLACDRNADYTVTGDVTLYAGWSDCPTAKLGDNTAAFTNGREAFLLFTPEEDGIYIIESHDNFDTFGYLYDQDGNELTSDDDGGENYNFRIDWQLAARELYRIGVRPYSGNSSGEIHFSIEKATNILTLDANGGYFGNPENTTQSVGYMAGDTFHGKRYIPTHTDFRMVFAGWYYDAACTQLACDRNADYTVTGDVTLYAGWSEGYIVTFDAGEGQFWGGRKTYDVTIPKGSVIGGYSRPESLDQSLGFDYWTLADGTRVDTWSYTPTEDVTLYAHYGRKYTVTFDANGGWFSDYGNQTVIDSIYVEGNTIFGRSYEPQHPDRLMVFTGWYYDAACTEPAFRQDESYTVTGDVTFYAGWSEGWIVSFDPGDGYFEEGTATSRTVPKGSALSSYPYPESSDPAYVFGYWELDGTKIKNIRNFIPEGDVTLRAHYVPARTVIFDANGGTFPGRKRVEWILPEEFEIDTEIRQMFGLVPTHSDERMAYTGWYSDAACTTLVAGPNDTITINGDMILYAGWAEGYYVSFDANGGSNAPAEPQLVSPEGTTALTGRVPSRDGWFFVGWADSADADAPRFYPNEEISTQADLTLYAVWKQPDFILPAGLTEIGEEAFSGGDFTFVQIPANTARIGAHAFSDCENLKYVAIMAYAPKIDGSAFDTDSGLTVLGNGSVVYQLAKDKGFHHVFLVQ